jgi:DNA-binding CsgD family transcriptional regulator
MNTAEPSNTPSTPTHLMAAATAHLTQAATTRAAATSTASHVQSLRERITANEIQPDATDFVSADVLAFVLNIQRAPTLIVDRKLQIIFANTAAETALRQGGSLRREGRRLAVQSEQARKFIDCVDAAGRGGPDKCSLILEGDGNRPAIAVWFRPVAPSLQTSSPLWSQGLIAVSMRVLSRPPVLASALLRQHFGLTTRQTEVVTRLALGASLSQIEASMGVKITTLRSHLSKAFQKTGTHGQSELISLVLSLVSPVQE